MLGDFKFNIIKCDTVNKYIRKENDSIVMDYLDVGFSFIRNSEGISCNRIEAMDGIGLLMYYDDKLIKHFEKPFIKIEFDDIHKTITITDEKENKNLLYLYYENERTSGSKEVLHDFSNKKYNIGDIVYPTTIGFYKESSNRISNRIDDFKNFNAIVYMAYFNQIKKAENKEVLLSEHFKGLCDLCSFKVIDKIGHKFYKIKLNYTDYDFKDFSDKVFWATDNTLSTLQEIKEDCLEFAKRF